MFRGHSLVQRHHKQDNRDKDLAFNLDEQLETPLLDDMETGVVNQMDVIHETGESKNTSSGGQGNTSGHHHHPEGVAAHETTTHDTCADSLYHDLGSGPSLVHQATFPAANRTAVLHSTSSVVPGDTSTPSQGPGNTQARAGWQRARRAVQSVAAFGENAPGLPHTHLPGSVQGIDLKRSPQEWEWLSQQLQAPVNAFVLDFAPDKVAMRSNISNAGLADLLKKTRPDWAKTRWINIDGVSWDVIQALALTFDLHPLAVEDVVHIPQRIKADFYDHFLYVSCHLISLANTASTDSYNNSIRSLQTSTSQQRRNSEVGNNGIETSHSVAPVKPCQPPAATPPSGSFSFPSAPSRAAAGGMSSPFQQQDAIGRLSDMGQGSIGNLEGSCKEGTSDEGVAGFVLPAARDDLDRLPGRRLGRTTSMSRPFAVSPAAHGTGRAVDHQLLSLPPALMSLDRQQPAASPLDTPPLSTTTSQRQQKISEVAEQESVDVLAGAAQVFSMSQQRAQHAQQAGRKSQPVQGPGAAELERTLAKNKLGSGVPVHKQQVSMFVIDNNTIISIFEATGTALTRPLLQQLREPRTLARDSTDASYLLCLLLDALADSAYPVVDAYSDIISGYESRILGSQPEAGITKELHLVQGDLATLRRTVLPTLHLVTGLRAHATTDALRAAAAGRAPSIAGPAAGSPTHQRAGKATSDDGGLGHQQQQQPRSDGKHSASNLTTMTSVTTPQQPLVSRLTKTYLGDVQDHLTSLLDALDSQTEACRDLIDLAFNLIAHGTNQAMQALTVVSVLFLPLTFLAGIYGMNFDVLPELHWEYGYVYFYSLSFLIVVTFLFIMRRKGMFGGSAAA